MRHPAGRTILHYTYMGHPAGRTKNLRAGEGGKLLLSSEEVPVGVGQLPVQLLQFGVPSPHHHLPINAASTFQFIIITIFISVMVSRHFHKLKLNYLPEKM